MIKIIFIYYIFIMKIVKKKNLIFEYKKNIYVVVCGSYRGKDIYGEKKTNIIILFCSTRQFKGIFEILLHED